MTLERADSSATDRAAVSRQAVRRTLGEAAKLGWGPDGKPEVEGVNLKISISHARDLTLLVAGEHEPLGCDIEPVEQRPSKVWVTTRRGA